MEVGDAEMKMASKGSGTKKTWKKTRANALAAKSCADKFHTDEGQYKYFVLGKGPHAKALNCARFGQGVLKAGGVPIHIGFWKLPSRITSASTTDESINKVYSLRDLKAGVSSALPKSCQSKTAFVTAARPAANVPQQAALLQEMGKMLERYHQFEQPLLRMYPIDKALGDLVVILRTTAVAAFLDKRDGTVPPVKYEGSPMVKFLKGELYPALVTEVAALTQEAEQEKALISKQDAKGVPPAIDTKVAQIAAHMDKLRELTSYATADELIKARVGAKILANTPGLDDSALQTKIKQKLKNIDVGGLAAYIGT